MKRHVNQPEDRESDIFDFIFIGIGASNSLIVLSLIKNNLFFDKKILVIEPKSKTNNDKTYCFWSSHEDSIIDDLSNIISHKYNKIKLNNSKIQDLGNQSYYYIRSIDLYNHTFEKLSQEKIDIERVHVTKIIENDNFCTVLTCNSIFRGRFIFDSRPPTFKNITENDIFLNQSFYGFHIKCENAFFQEDAFEMMNFNVEQNGFTQFIYILPFSSNEALVELTRFGSEKIDIDYASDLLKKFILNEFGNFTVISKEEGCIPMTTYFNNPNLNKSVLNTGTAANLIKPSTGYGFKKMYLFGQKVSKIVSLNQFDKFNMINLSNKNRFKFYDRLLLIILKKWPFEGKIIFTKLYRKQSPKLIFLFLDEKTSFWEELKIFASLPISPFLRAVYFFLMERRYLRHILSFLIVLIYLILSYFNLDIAHTFSNFAILVGLICIGIPHGALDHLLIKSNKFSMPLFLFKYCLGIIIYYLLWQLFPLLSLFIFIVYSSFHFGESELIEERTKIQIPLSYLKAFLLGFSILIFIISSHSNESINILSTLNFNIELTKFRLNNLPLIISFFSFTYILIQNILHKDNPYLGLLFLLLIGVNIPLELSFGLYFIMQHSTNAWKHLKKGLRVNSILLYKKSFPYSIGAFLICGLFMFRTFGLDSHNFLWMQFFIFIACISLPHFIIMHLFYKNKSF